MYSGFPKDLIALVLCPRDSGQLQLRPGPYEDTVLDGEAQCRMCGFPYEISHGILCIQPGQQPLDGVGRDEQQARDQRAARYEEHFAEWENAEELSTILSCREQFRSKVVLDLASGTGRLTRSIGTLAAAMIAADFSQESLRVFASTVAPELKVGLIWADAVQLRFVPESFDVILSTQLLEHIASREGRVRLLRSACSWLKPSGTFLLTAYYYSLLRQILCRGQEGFHAGGIFYHRFTISEIRAELGAGFRIIETRPLQPDRRALARLPCSGSWARKGIAGLIFARLVGQLLFVRTEKMATGVISSEDSHVA